MNEVDSVARAANHEWMDNPSVKATIDARFSTMDSVLRRELAEFQCQASEEMAKYFREFRSEMRKDAVWSIKWCVASAVATGVANLGIMAFLLSRIEGP